MISGNDAIVIPAAGIGIPLNENCCAVSILNLANLHAPAQGTRNAGNKAAMLTSSPSTSFAKLIRNSW